jgi:hypothetical protein
MRPLRESLAAKGRGDAMEVRVEGERAGDDTPFIVGKLMGRMSPLAPGEEERTEVEVGGDAPVPSPTDELRASEDVRLEPGPGIDAEPSVATSSFGMVILSPLSGEGLALTEPRRG